MTPEARQADYAAQRARWFTPSAPAPPPEPTLPELARSLAAFEVAVARWWARARAARVRAGACQLCGERLCPRVGGRDQACVPA